MGIQAEVLIKDFFDWKCGRSNYSFDRRDNCYYVGALWRGSSGHRFDGVFNMFAKNSRKVVAYVNESNSFASYDPFVLNRAVNYVNSHTLSLNIYFNSKGLIFVDNTWMYIAEIDIYEDTSFENFRKSGDALIATAREKMLAVIDKYWELK